MVRMIVPWSWLTALPSRAIAGGRRSRACSGSTSPISSVEPTMSANSTVTTLRSPSFAARSCRSPQLEQKRAVSKFRPRQIGQAAKLPPHDVQVLSSDPIAAWQAGQRITNSPPQVGLARLVHDPSQVGRARLAHYSAKPDPVRVSCAAPSYHGRRGRKWPRPHSPPVPTQRPLPAKASSDTIWLTQGCRWGQIYIYPLRKCSTDPL